jgi:hypothetical protein
MSPSVAFENIEDISHQQRPAAKRQRTRDSFKAKTSIREKQREQGKENVPLHVSKVRMKSSHAAANASRSSI